MAYCAFSEREFSDIEQCPFCKARREFMNNPLQNGPQKLRSHPHGGFYWGCGTHEHGSYSEAWECIQYQRKVAEESSRDTPKMPLLDWLKERYENCLRIAAQKIGEEQKGWQEDAYYFRLAITILQEPKSNAKLKRYIRNLR